MKRDIRLISVIIPTLNERGNLPGLLHALAREKAPHEAIVADGFSDDGTAAIAHEAGARLAPPAYGRGAQLAAGATLARGDVLLFLHADSRFPAGGLARLRAALDRRPDAVGGNFRFGLDCDDAFCRWVSRFYAFIRARGLYYGDSGIFTRARTYRAIGGIKPIALMEDYDFVRRMECAGPTICLAGPPLITSARRFRGRRPAAIVTEWLWLHSLYRLGVGPDTLARFYDAGRRRERAA